MTESQDAGAGAAPPRLNAIGVTVADMATAVAFYTRLGLTFPGDAGSEDHAEAPLGGGVRLMLDTEALMRQLDPETPADRGRVAFAAELPTPADVDRCYAELAADGFGVKEPWDAFWGQRYATLRDPDGTHVDLYAPLPTPPSGE